MIAKIYLIIFTFLTKDLSAAVDGNLREIALCAKLNK